MAAALLTGACASHGADGGPATDPPEVCGPVTPCGGDLAGIWAIDAMCLLIPSPFVQPECGRVVEKVDTTASGTVSYTPSASDPSSGTEELRYAFTFTAREHFDDGCLSALGLAAASSTTCTNLERLLSSSFAVICEPATSACECTLEDQQEVKETRAYSLSNLQIVVSPTDKTDYCRTGDLLVESAVTNASTSRVKLHRMP